jgi:hypothetical protein
MSNPALKASILRSREENLSPEELELVMCCLEAKSLRPDLFLIDSGLVGVDLFRLREVLHDDDDVTENPVRQENLQQIKP